MNAHLAAVTDPSAPPPLPDVDLGALAAKGIKPPKLIAGGMLYPGAVHCLAGPPAGGKSTLMAWWMLRHIRDGGNVMFLDEEGGPEQVAEKFLEIGAEPAELAPPRMNYIPFPTRSWGFADIVQLRERIEDRQPGIIAWDTTAAFLAIAGRDENSAADVTGFWQRVLMPCAKHYGAAVIGADHIVKSGEHTGYARGTGAKKAASDVVYMLDVLTPFNRYQDGALKLTTQPGKDRRGYLAQALRVDVTVGSEIRLVFSEATAEGETKTEMRPAAREIMAVLNGEWISIREIGDLILLKYGHPLRRETISRELNSLLRTCDVDRITPPSGGAALWRSTNGL